MSTANNGQELAYPFVETHEMQGESISFGLTKRELFAAMAMQGILANPGGPIQADDMNGSVCNCTRADVGDLATSLADALLRALSTPPEEP